MFSAHEQYAAGALGGNSLAIGPEDLAGIDGSLYGGARGYARGLDDERLFGGNGDRQYGGQHGYGAQSAYETPRTFGAGPQPMQPRDYNARPEADQSSHAQLKARGRDLAASIGATIEALSGGRPLAPSTLDMMNPIGGPLGARMASENVAPGGMVRGAFDLAGRPLASGGVQGISPTLPSRPTDDVFGHGFGPYGPQRTDANPLTPPQSTRTPGDANTATKVRDIIAGGREGSAPQRTHSTAGTEEGYRARLDALNADMERLVQQHAKVVALKDDALSGMSADLADARRSLEREVRARAADKERHTETVRSLKRRIAELEATLDDMERAARENREPVLPSDVQRAFNERITEMARSFALEKEAAIANQRAHLRAELELIVPRLRERCDRAIEERVKALRAQFVAEYRAKLEERLGRLREDMLAERRACVREARERAEADGRAAVERVRAHYELKLMDMESACTRRVLDRLRRSGQAPARDSDDSYL